MTTALLLKPKRAKTHLRLCYFSVAAALIAITAPLISLAADPAKETPPVRVVFDRVTFYEPGAKPTNMKTVPWRDGLTALRAIIAAGGISTPPTRKAKIIRRGSEIPLDLQQLIRGDTDVALQPGDTLFLY
jgi:hypothetical protein